MRKIPFINGEYYHIYNRGVDKRKVFLCHYDYLRFLKSLREFNCEDPVVSLYLKDRLLAAKPLKTKKLPQGKKIVEIISYCLIPNHFHLILKQLKEGGISEFMKRVGGGYTWHFNYKYKRSGSLFQGTFKAIHIDTNSYLLYLSAYVNGNYMIHKIKNINWRFTGLNDKKNLCNMKVVSDEFGSISKYKKYVYDVSREIKEHREDMEKYLLE
jgi:putative transposase